VTIRNKIIMSTAFLAAVASIGFALYHNPSTAQGDKAFTVESAGPVIREYLLKNPEVVIEAIEAYQKKEEEAQQESAKENLKKHEGFLKQVEPSKTPLLGNPDGDITIVEFYDYNCGYCKRAHNEILTLLETDKNVRFVMKEMPILSASSFIAAKYSLASQNQGKFAEFHDALMKNQGALSEDSILAIADNLGLDKEKLKADANSQETERTIMDNIRIARELGINGTPGFVIEDKLVPGYIPADQMKQFIDDARKAQ
jgi:protein-disulfide isomerase